MAISQDIHFSEANLSETLIGDNLFDEYRIGVSPVILGSGRPLFSNGIPKGIWRWSPLNSFPMAE